MNNEDLWQKYQQQLRQFLASRLSEPSDVDDLLQDIIIKAHQNLPVIKNDNIKPWLFQVAKNTIIDFYRARAKDNVIAEDELWYNNNDASIEQSLSRCIAPFIQSLPKESADLLTAIDLENMTQKEYAQQSNIPYSTLKSRVQKARLLLRNQFEECCHFAWDHSGKLMEFEPKINTCKQC